MSPKQKTSYSGAVLRLAREEREKAAADPAERMRRSLESHERVIENARRSFVALGQALHAIRTERLYDSDFATFAEYLDARWDVSEAYANRMINAALVAIEATPIGVEINSEAVARELVGLDPEALKAVWDEATRRAAGGRVTAALVKEVRRSLEPPKPPALEGEVVDPVSNFPDVEQALEEFHRNQPSGLVDTSPVDESGEDHPEGKPGDATEDADARVDGDETDEEASPEDASVPVDEPERAAGAGVSLPSAPDSEERGETPARREAPEWLVRITAIIAAVDDFTALNTTGIADVLDDDLFADLGLAVSKLDISYAAMSKKRNRAAA
jgi:hypothetical protein